MEKLLYKSTRGLENNVPSSLAIIKGIADDGGLFVPDRIPKVDMNYNRLSNMDYKEMAYFVMSKFFTDFTEEELKKCIEKAYDDKFDTDEIVPLKKIGDKYFLELFHGPTLAFKDMALSILPYLLTTSAKKQNITKDIVILTATSGDTGKAALQGFTNVDGTKIIVFFPEEGVSKVQKKQMVSHEGNNTFVVGINGNFDDAQSGVKKIFRDEEFLELLNKNGYMFSSANSINIGRLVPQIVYYFYGYMQLYKNCEIAKGEKVNVAVPTGNFGDILAAYYAKQMGLPIEKLICASNSNNVLSDFLKTGIYNKNREFYTTISPSMDILISSNLERLLYNICNKDSSKVKEFMNSLESSGTYEITEDMKKELNDFYGDYATERETKEIIKEVYKKYNYIMDTHTAVAYKVNEKYENSTNDCNKTIIASTASPYKFTHSVMEAIDEKYGEYDDFKLIKEMSNLTGKEAPLAVLKLENAKVIHKSICEKDKMKEKIKEILNI